MSKLIAGHQRRVLALSFALGLIAVADAASIAHAANSSRYSLFPQTEQDWYTDPQTGISQPDNPYLGD